MQPGSVEHCFNPVINHNDEGTPCRGHSLSRVNYGKALSSFRGCKMEIMIFRSWDIGRLALWFPNDEALTDANPLLKRWSNSAFMILATAIIDDLLCHVSTTYFNEEKRDNLTLYWDNNKSNRYIVKSLFIVTL